VNSRLKEALRRKIDGHNRLVRLSTVGTVLGVFVMWAILYFVGNWLPVLFITVVKGVDAEIPPKLNQWVLLVFAIWLFVGMIDRVVRRRRPESLDQPAGASIIGMLMLPPRVTYSILDNVRNRIGLNEHELELASDFLERLYWNGKMQMQSIPVELPAEDSRERILSALRLIDLVRELEVRKTDFLALANPERVKAFVQA
jgi:hypothetical protein